MIKSLLIVGAGSFVGGALRYAISMQMRSICGQGFPWATLTVNLVGCFFFGGVIALFGRHGDTAHPWCMLLTTGLCGGFTTFSAFAHESMQMLQCGQYVALFAYVATSIVVGIALMGMGYMIIK